MSSGDGTIPSVYPTLATVTAASSNSLRRTIINIDLNNILVEDLIGTGCSESLT